MLGCLCAAELFPVTVADLLVQLLLAYTIFGAGFGVLFVVRGVDRIDPAAREGTWGFRLLILPGTVALWPWLLLRWVRGTQPPIERNAHRDAAS